MVAETTWPIGSDGTSRSGAARWRTLGALLLLAATACGDAQPDRAPTDLDRLDAPSASASPSVPPTVTVPADAPRVAFLGDSIGAGLHLAEHQAFPARLQRRLADELPFQLINASESGRTTAGGAAGLDWTLRSKPDLVVLELGGNDGLRGIPVADVEKNLRSMIEGARAAGARVLLLGVRMPPNYGEYAEAFDALYPQLAAEYGLAFVPYFMDGVGGVPELNLPDGLHPTPEGHERLADNVIGALRSVLGELRTPAADPAD